MSDQSGARKLMPIPNTSQPKQHQHKLVGHVRNGEKTIAYCVACKKLVRVEGRR